MDDPRSVEAVDPDVLGVRRIVVETTRDPVTTGVERYFPSWMDRLRRTHARLDGSTSGTVSSNDLDVVLWTGSFSTRF